MENLIIIGTGCAGYTGHLRGAGRADVNPLILACAQPGGTVFDNCGSGEFSQLSQRHSETGTHEGMMEQAL